MKPFLIAVLALMSTIVNAQSSTEQKLDSLFSLMNEKDGQQRIEITIEAATLLTRHDLDSCLSLLNELLNNAELSAYPLLNGKVYTTLGSALTYKGAYDSAHIVFDYAMELGLDDDYEHLTTVYNNRGITFFYQGSFPEAAEQWEKFQDLAIEHNSESDISRSYNNLGVVYMYSAQYEKALTQLLKSAEIDEKNNNIAGLAKCYNNIALVHGDLKNYDKAHEYYDKSLQLKIQLDDKMGVMSAYINTGILYKNQRLYDSALTRYNKAVALAEEMSYQKGLLDCYASLSTLHNNLGQSELSAEYSTKGLAIAEESNDLEAAAVMKINLADAYQRMGKGEEGLTGLLTSLDFMKSVNRKEVVNESYLILSRIYSQMGDYRQALEYHQMHKELSDSILNETNAKAISEVQTKYETEKKEQQIALQDIEIKNQQAALRFNYLLIGALIIVLILGVIIAILARSRERRKQNQLLQEAKLQLKETQIESAIASQEQERKRFARDLHDGFGQFISVLNLNLKSLEKGTANRDEVFESSAQVLEQMYRELKTICFNLMPETLIKHGIVNGIKEFADRINTAGNVIVEVDTFGMEDRLEDIQEISLYRITQEWVNNIIKYSNASKINIQLTRDEEELTLLIEDDGLGFDKSLLIHSSGNGWKNLNSRANLIKGVLELDTTIGVAGNALILNAPISRKETKKVAVEVSA